MCLWVFEASMHHASSNVAQGMREVAEHVKSQLGFDYVTPGDSSVSIRAGPHSRQLWQCALRTFGFVNNARFWMRILAQDLSRRGD